MADSGGFYAVLGVGREASAAEVKKSYMRLARRFHPDKNPNAGDKFKDISEAYRVLSDVHMRSVYDRYGEKGIKEGMHNYQGQQPQPQPQPQPQQQRQQPQQQQPQQRRPSTPAKQPPRERFQPPRPVMKEGSDIRHQYNVTLGDLYNGKDCAVGVFLDRSCGACSGTSLRPGTRLRRCSACMGTGRGGSLQCTQCGGRGYALPKELLCQVCRGKGTKKQSEKLVFSVEKGMVDRQLIVLSGESNQGLTVRAGSVIIELCTVQHASFKRVGNDLFYKRELSLLEALTEFEFVVTQLDGRELRVAGKGVVAPGDTRVVENEGMPHYTRPASRGSLFVQFDVSFPTSPLSKQQQKLLKKVFPVAVPLPLPDEVEDVSLHPCTKAGTADEAPVDTSSCAQQ